MPLTCLDTLVGLSNRECSCYDTDRPGNWNTSGSGYYLTDREYGFPIKEAVFANIDCGHSNIWDEMEEARTQAIRDVKSDIQAGLSQVRKKRLSAWEGRIGTVETDEPNQYHTNTKAVVGVQLRPQRLKYASFVVKAIWLYQNTTGSVDVNLTSNDSSFTGFSESVSAVANQTVRHPLGTEKELPFYSLYVDELKYNFSYAVGSAKPLQNKIYDAYCPLGPWSKHMTVDGFSLDSLDNTYDASSSDAYGLAIEGYFKMNHLDWICDLTNKGGDEYLDMIARLIQLKGAIKLINTILESGKINFYTIMKKEALWGKRNNRNKLYGELLVKLIQEVPSSILEIYGSKKNDPQIISIIT